MKILFVPGIKTWKFYLWGWKKTLKQSTNVDEFKVRKDMYIYTQHKRCQAITESVKQDIVEFKPDIVIAHSFGGIITKTALSQLPNHSVKVFCSLASPHGMQLKSIVKCYEFLQTPRELSNVPHVLSYGGTYDPIVPASQSILPNAKHTDLPVEHMAFLLSPKIRSQVLNDCLSECKNN